MCSITIRAAEHRSFPSRASPASFHSICFFRKTPFRIMVQIVLPSFNAPPACLRKPTQLSLRVGKRKGVECKLLANVKHSGIHRTVPTLRTKSEKQQIMGGNYCCTCCAVVCGCCFQETRGEIHFLLTGLQPTRMWSPVSIPAASWRCGTYGTGDSQRHRRSMVPLGPVGCWAAFRSANLFNNKTEQPRTS